MKIAVDARPVFQEATLRGVGKTLLDLYRNVARLRPNWTFLMYYQIENGSDHFAGMPNILRRQVDHIGDRFHAWQHVWLPGSSWWAGADLLHCHGAIAPAYPLMPLVSTIHDLTPLEFRPRDATVQAWANNVRRGARRALRILTPSDHVRGEIHRLLDVPLSKITTVYWGPNEHCHRVTDAARLATVRAAYGLSPGQAYLLHFGMANPRKNTRRLLDAWASLPDVLRADNVLLVVGIEAPALRHFEELIGTLGIEASCRLHGYVPEEDVSALISDATAVAYLSLSEGFGLPILDAFACGAAVLASNTTCLPEVAGDGALFVDPTSTMAIREGIARILQDSSLRVELIGRGSDRLRRFSWTACAEQVIEVLSICAR